MAPVQAETLTLEIRHLWNNQPLSIPSAEISTDAGERINLTRLAYLLSEPRLKRSTDSGPLIRSDWFAFVDATDSVSRITISGIPAGSYQSLQLHLGLDEQTDRADPSQYPAKHPLNPIVNNLHWSPQGGYIFVALEGHARPDGAFSYHLGNPRNRVTCEIPVAFQINSRAASPITIRLDFHLDRLFNTETPLATQAQTSTHSREGDPLAETLKKRLATVFTAKVSASSPSLTGDEAEDNNQTPGDLVGTPYPFRIKKGFPIPPLPTDYPLTNERVALGRQLFHETQLSLNGEISCASCHHDENAFADSNRLSSGVDDRVGTRNSMPLFNLAWKSSFFWDGRVSSLREQALVPIQDHVEMDETLENVTAKLAAHPAYPAQFQKAFGSPEITAERLGIAIEQFVLTLTSFDSRFDRATRGGEPLSEQEKRGFELFMTEYDPRRQQFGADCFHCHGGALFTDHQFHNNGLRPTDDHGLETVTGIDTDRDKFVTPSLRNIALTAPYMHDGRFATLEETVAHYTSGGVHRSSTLDPNLAKHPEGGVPLNESDRAALVAFLYTLTDEQYLTSESPSELSRK